MTVAQRVQARSCSNRGCYTAGLGAILGLFGSDRAGTALARQRWTEPQN